MNIPEIPNLINYAIPFFILLIILEIVVSAKINLKTYQFKDAATSITMGLGNVFIGIISKGLVFGLLLYIYNHYSIFKIPFTWWAWLLLVFADDFTYYWFHRISHVSRFFWASHIIHHSSQHYNLSTALRQTWTGNFTSFVFWLWLPFIGFHPLMILTQMSISLLYQFWIHTETIDKLPTWYEAIFNTPSHHRVHHATNPQYLDRNHAGIFIIWDKLFGTFEPEVEKPIYGLTKNINSYNPLYVAFHEWMALFKDSFTSKTSLLKRFQYFVKPPGWRHDGSGQLSCDMRKAWEQSTTKLT
ncbi:MAG: C-5 sterol desaturase [Flavobacteriales bacterium CG03_land_8_20_14_0_80_35_15]|nr:sterol desaturase family protein [Zetaproteobacteria bacterium]NDK18105.1 sterol desaturase family protein [Flavobacteriales bacterium]OIO11050.1 MAG: C-5 sterol desaturase [Flavobacteriaceae bacterium CG1_02_35_72]PIV19123.1 MAG: C-5 sterol desaturase [Flavobacteriales bacterium CG03_land_8_20_14_0_80_35_15]PIX07092.1 MAG: C-5 sterol desaturase [Flavobacteriales bacterium CG_4_8_14_3_um_filter_35_10]PJA05946.1 MAG: C-5 sterol desaturase [Flavobacteriales bacterium CG_4_10_14_0_2_um_filter_